MNTIPFNVNHHVRVKLTPYGKSCLRRNYDEIAKRAPLAMVRHPFSLPPEDKDGWTRFQMHELMSELGEYIHMGCEPPFETEIQIEIL